MAERLQIDFERLDSTTAQLQGIKGSLSDTIEMSANMAAYTGHALLGAAVVYFAERWNLKRTDMIDAVEALRAGMEKVSHDLSDTDSQLGAQLTDPAPASTASASAGGHAAAAQAF